LNKKWYPYLLIAILAIVLLVVRTCKAKQGTEATSTTTRTVPKNSSNKVNRDVGFDRRTSYLQYSKHAKCRMDCRKITQAEVEQIMREGKINYAKSDLKNARCPRYALEGYTSDGQRVRIVFAQCNESTTVVTVIDLETEFECHCPGDN